MNTINNQSWVSYESFYQAINSLPDDKDKLALWNQIAEYGLYETIRNDLSPIANALFITIKPQIDANIRKRHNGKKGGRPKKEEITIGYENENHRLLNEEPQVNEIKTIGFQNIETLKPNVNVNVNDNANGNVNVNEYVIARKNVRVLSKEQNKLVSLCMKNIKDYPKVLDDYSQWKQDEDIQIDDDTELLKDFIQDLC